MSELHLSPEQFEAQIDVQRAQLAETVDQLAHKLDVKAQVRTRMERITPAQVTIGVGALTVLGVLVWWSKSR